MVTVDHLPEGEQQPDQERSLRDEYAESMIWEDMPSPFKRMIKSLYYSTACKVIYLVILAANAALAIWVMVVLINGTYPHTAFYVFELLINVVLLVDVIIRMWVQQCYRYWKSAFNIFEFVLVSVCTILTIITMVRK